MYCNKCGEENPEEAVYCRNCGAELRQEVKKTEIIENIPNQNYNQQPKSENKGNDDWKCCCGCLILIFVIFAISSLLMH